MVLEVPREFAAVWKIFLQSDGSNLSKNTLNDLLSDIRKIKDQKISPEMSGMVLAAEGALVALIEGRELSLPKRILNDKLGRELLDLLIGWNLPPTASEMERGFLAFWREAAKMAGQAQPGR